MGVYYEFVVKFDNFEEFLWSIGKEGLIKKVSSSSVPSDGTVRVTYDLLLDYEYLGIDCGETNCSHAHHSINVYKSTGTDIVLVRTTVKWWGTFQSEWTQNYLSQVYMWLIPYCSFIALVTESITEYYPDDYLFNYLLEHPWYDYSLKLGSEEFGEF